MNDTKAQTTEVEVLWHFTMSLDAFVAGPNHEGLDGRTNRPGVSGCNTQAEGTSC